MSSTAIFYKNQHVERRVINLKYDIFDFTQKKYFLLCKNCFWMASTIPAIKGISRMRYKKCPLCVNDTDRFLICNESF
jgi:hypothetical protein